MPAAEEMFKIAGQCEGRKTVQCEGSNCRKSHTVGSVGSNGQVTDDVT